MLINVDFYVLLPQFFSSDCGIFMLTFMESLIFSNKIVQFKEV